MALVEKTERIRLPLNAKEAIRLRLQVLVYCELYKPYRQYFFNEYRRIEMQVNTDPPLFAT